MGTFGIGTFGIGAFAIGGCFGIGTLGAGCCFGIGIFGAGPALFLLGHPDFMSAADDDLDCPWLAPGTMTAMTRAT
jgi:hypothetical protein